MTRKPKQKAAKPKRRRLGHLRDLLRSAHWKQAFGLAVIIGGLAALDGRPVREFLSAAGAVLVVQLALGLINDVLDAQADAKASAPHKPVAAQRLERDDATWTIIVLLMISVPLAVQNGWAAAVALLSGIPIGMVHNRWLSRTMFSPLGWMLTFALFVPFLSYGGWGGQYVGDPPTWQLTASATLLGLAAHLATSIGDLVTDRMAGSRSLPLRLGLRIGARGLLVVTVGLTLAAVAAVVTSAVTVGLYA